MEKSDFYEILGVDRDAGAAALKSAYRKLAKQYHPDANPGDAAAEQKFKEINEAYDILKDDEKRAAYDRFGHAAFDGSAGAGRARPGGFDFGSGFADIFDEMFGDVMGGRGRPAGGGRARGGDLRYDMEVSLEDAYKGCETRIKVPSSVTCDSCKGSGAAKGSHPVTCSHCQGRGKVRSQQGFFTIERTCPGCHGAGRVIEDPCRPCGGTGRVRKEKTLAVNVPAGVEDGMRIRLTGEGEAGLQGGPAGDLYIFITVRPHTLFSRDGMDIYCRVPIPMTTAALGGSVEVPAIDGTRAKVNIPSGTQGGHQFRLRGKGMQGLHGRGRGDMYIEIAVETPVNLSKRQRELLEEFNGAAGSGGKPVNPQSEGFFSRVKDLWEDLTD